MSTFGDKPRLKDIAHLADVSIATASMALSDHPKVSIHTKRKVLAISRRLGYRKGDAAVDAVNRSDAAVRRFGLMIVGADVRHATNAPLLFHLSTLGMARNVRFEFTGTPAELEQEATPTPQQIDRHMQHVLRFATNLDGLVLMGHVDRALLSRLREAGLPHIVAGHVLSSSPLQEPPPVTTVAFDDVAMGYTATRWLIERGHRRIAFAAEVLPPGLSHERWLCGYRLALVDAGLPVSPELILVTHKPEGGAGPIADAVRAMADPPTAYCVPDTRLTASLMANLRSRGVHPDPSSVIFASLEELVRTFGLSAHPRLLGQTEVLAEQCVDQLIRVSSNSKAAPVQVLAPFNLIPGHITQLDQ